MNIIDEYFQFDINKVYTIIEKNENDGFCFENPCRDWDGFVLFTAGNITYRDHNNAVHNVKNGDLVLLRKNECYKFNSNDFCSYITSAFDFSIVCWQLNNIPSVIHTDDKQYKDIHKLCVSWQNHMPDSYMFCKATLLKLYTSIICNNGKYEKKSIHAVKMAQEYIHNNFKQNFSADDIADYCSLSPSYLRSVFHKSTGMTIIEYRDDLRIQNAKEMLTSRLFSVKETAYELGYCDIYYFSRIFKRLCGVSPAKFATNIFLN